MALSNILNEPRRELTEQAVGLVILIALFWPAYYVGEGLYRHDPPSYQNTPNWWFDMFAGVLFTAMGWVGVITITLFMHRVGEKLCNLLAQQGWEVRPKKRYVGRRC